MLRRFLKIVVALVALAPAASAVAQPAGGSIAGLVRDASGAAIPGATVRIVNEVTGVSLQAVSDEQGAYRTAALGLGAYTRRDHARRVRGGRAPDRALGRPDRRRRRHAEPVAVDGVGRGDRPARRGSWRRRCRSRCRSSTATWRPNTGAFNVNRLKELIPTVQFYSTNPRNSAINIRGLGAPFGLTNDGLEPGVGLYIDGVFYARPASATLDFLDVDRIEVLRGPQGTLFGKNTTAGAINVTTRKPSFTPGTDFELNFGDLRIRAGEGVGHRPARPEGGGPAVVLRHAARRHGLQRHDTEDRVNDLNNLGLRGQVLFAPSDSLAITASVDHTRQRPEGYTQVVAGVAPTLRPANRQYAQIAADLGLRASELQRVRPRDRRRYAAALVSGSRRHVGERRLEAADAGR